MKAERIRVKGKVQGVFFRASTKDKADELGIRGWVRNETDGSVLIEAEGSEERMEQFVAWCWQGPSSAHVEQVEEEPIEPGNFDRFAIAG